MRQFDVFNSASIVHLQQLYHHLFSKSFETAVAGASNLLPQPQICPACKAELDAGNELYSRFAICDYCGHHLVWSAFNRVEHLADPGTFRPIGRRIQSVNFLGFVDQSTYSVKLLQNQQKTGLYDAILLGRCCIGQTETVLGVLDFRFMGGSMGSVVGEQITVAFEYARKHRLPVVIVVNSGGARMQEGIISLMQMPKTAVAFQRFHTSGLLYLSILASPTTGGVFASFASLGDVMLAEPKALIGFAGPRVAEQAMGQKLPAGSHQAETMLAAGMLDAIVTRQDMPQVVAALLKPTAAHAMSRHSQHMQTNHLPSVTVQTAQTSQSPAKTAWETVNIARHPDRPTARDYIRSLSPNFLELQGDRCYGDDPTIVAGLGDIDGRAVIFIGQQRLLSSQNNRPGEIHARPKPEGFRKAIRIMELAAQLHCPLVTLIDTIGADPGVESEQHGMAWSLAHCLSTMSNLPVPIVTAIIGEGASGGAVVLAVADRIMMLQHAIYEVISPEGAATILYRDAQRAEEVAAQLNLTAEDCLRLGVIDTIIPEPGAGAHTNPPQVMQALQHSLLHALIELERVPVKQLLAQRYRKFRRHGQFQHEQRPFAVAIGEQRRNVLHLLTGRMPKAIASAGSFIILHSKGQKHGLAS